MSKKKTSTNKSLALRLVAYLGAFALILGLVIIGSIDKSSLSSTDVSMNAIAENNYQVSTDQISELYVVANVSNAMNLASVDTVSSNYVISSVMRETGQANSGHLEKPSIVNTSGISKGVIRYTVAENDTMRSLAQRYNLTIDQIRWSNGLQSEDLTPNQTIVLPGVPGIVYTVQPGDTPEALSSRYGSPLKEIIAINDLEDTTTLTEGAQIVLPGGVLPVAERPETRAAAQVAAARAATRSTYSYLGSTSGRENMHVVSENVYTDPGNRMTPGQCTWYAWWWRKHSPLSLGALPDGMMGSANVWASVLAGYGYRVDHIPQVGAVFQTTAGYYGHVGVVVGINPDGSLIVREMNYGYRAFVVTESTVPANLVGNFTYIH